jgi:ABC-type bacteriocin/lantibiotic exporter with double-glycine peptidase domain
LCLVWWLNALVFWYGAKLIEEGTYSIGNVFTVRIKD